MQKIRRKGAVPVMEQRELDGMEYLVFPALEETGMVRHMFGTRVGGVSEGKYATVNFSYTLGDRRECVDENYRRAARILTRDGDIGRFVVGRQTHTTNVRVVTEEDRGKGVTREQDYQDVDALITNVPGLVLTTFHADCPPVYIVDPVHRAIGLAHSGWKGTIARIVGKAVRMLCQEAGCAPSALRAYVGPHIGVADLLAYFRSIVPDNTFHGFLTRKTAFAEIQRFTFKRYKLNIMSCVLRTLCRLLCKYFGIAVITQT